MRDDRKRQPVRDDYALALGRAAYCFVICEWNVVWCCEKIRPGRLKKIVGEELTGGAIAKVFVDLTRNMPKCPERDELSRAAQTFLGLVKVRNSIFHGKPCTGPSGDARLNAEKVLELRLR